MFVSSTAWGAAVYARTIRNGGQPFFYQSYFEPAVMIACGRGFLVSRQVGAPPRHPCGAASHSCRARLVIVRLDRNGMQLALERDFNRHDSLNRSYWPASYEQIRRLADCQNCVFRNYARKHQLRFIDLAVEYPQDPALTDDAIHFRYPGIVLEAWTLLQHLMRIIDDGIAQGRRPRAQQVVRAVHPAFDQPSPRLVRFDSLQARCH